MGQIADSARVTFPAKRVAGDALLPAMCLRSVPGPGSGCGLALSSVPGVNGRLDRRVLLRCGEPLKVSETTRWVASGSLPGAQEREDVLDALRENRVGDLPVGQCAGQLQCADHHREDAERLDAC